jgi:hypothetical protein
MTERCNLRQSQKLKKIGKIFGGESSQPLEAVFSLKNPQKTNKNYRDYLLSLELQPGRNGTR